MTAACWSLVLAVGLHGLALAAPPPRPDSWSNVERVVAVGDVHGDFDALVQVLRAGNVIDEQRRWSGGRTHLVQVGDALDRGAETRRVLDLLMELEVQALRAGGAVHALIGNHEAMVLLGDFRYVSRAEVESFGGWAGYQAAFAPDGRYSRWIRSHHAVVRINDIIYVHGGLSPAMTTWSLRGINEAIRQELAERNWNGLAMRQTGPLWYAYNEDYEENRSPEAVRALAATLGHFGARALVVGHMVTSHGISVSMANRLIQIDVGLMALYQGPRACLLIERGALYELRPGLPPQRLPDPPPMPAAKPALINAAPAQSRPAL